MTSNTEVLEDGVLRFRGVTTEEQGGYVCTASNSVSTVSLLARLRVRGENVLGRPTYVSSRAALGFAAVLFLA